MPDPAPGQSSRKPGDFASLLASLTGAGKEPAQPWDMDELGEDVATISYEQALRAHRRVRPPEPAPEPVASHSPAPAESAEKTKACKTVSITVRVTDDEGRQLHARAKEAGLSVSAYLRSCIFEAESLRTQVKEALSQIRAAVPQEAAASEQPKPPQTWRARLLPFWYRRRARQSHATLHQAG